MSDKSDSPGQDPEDIDLALQEDQDHDFNDDRIEQQDGENENETETDGDERKPFEGMSEYAESTMQELLAIYGLAGGELAKTVGKQAPPTFLNPAVGHHLQQQHQQHLQQQQHQSQQQQGKKSQLFIIFTSNKNEAQQNTIDFYNLSLRTRMTTTRAIYDDDNSLGIRKTFLISNLKTMSY